MWCQLFIAPVAQWIRHRPTEPGIAGSSPAGGMTNTELSKLLAPPPMLLPVLQLHFAALVVVGGAVAVVAVAVAAAVAAAAVMTAKKKENVVAIAIAVGTLTTAVAALVMAVVFNAMHPKRIFSQWLLVRIRYSLAG